MRGLFASFLVFLKKKNKYYIVLQVKKIKEEVKRYFSIFLMFCIIYLNYGQINSLTNKNKNKKKGWYACASEWMLFVPFKQLM